MSLDLNHLHISNSSLCHAHNHTYSIRPAPRLIINNISIPTTSQYPSNRYQARSTAATPSQLSFKQTMKHACGFDSLRALHAFRQHPVAESWNKRHLGEMQGRGGSSIQLSRGQSLYSTQNSNRTAHRTFSFPFFLIPATTPSLWPTCSVPHIACSPTRSDVNLWQTFCPMKRTSPGLRSRVGLHTSGLHLTRRSCQLIVFPSQHPSTTSADD